MLCKSCKRFHAHRAPLTRCDRAAIDASARRRQRVPDASRIAGPAGPACAVGTRACVPKCSDLYALPCAAHSQHAGACDIQPIHARLPTACHAVLPLVRQHTKPAMHLSHTHTVCIGCAGNRPEDLCRRAWCPAGSSVCGAAPALPLCLRSLCDLLMCILKAQRDAHPA